MFASHTFVVLKIWDCIIIIIKKRKYANCEKKKRKVLFFTVHVSVLCIVILNHSKWNPAVYVLWCLHVFASFHMWLWLCLCPFLSWSDCTRSTKTRTDGCWASCCSLRSATVTPSMSWTQRNVNMWTTWTRVTTSPTSWSRRERGEKARVAEAKNRPLRHWDPPPELMPINSEMSATV